MGSIWFVVGALVTGLLLFGRPRPLPARDPAPAIGSGTVRIVIPARNESASLGNLLGDLARSRPGSADVVVVDDRSTDDTAAIARSFAFVTLLDPGEPPRGWRGKPWACAAGAGPVAGLDPADVLVFLDADVRVGPGALDTVLAERSDGDGVVSVQPFHTAPTAIEQLSGLFNVVSMMGIGAGGDRPSGLFGPVICCSTAAYERVGGHRSVRSAVTEDVALARRFTAASVPLRVFAGGDRISFRMYPTGLAALVEGWTKNMATGAGSISPVRSLGVAWWIAGTVSAAGAVVDLAAGRLGVAAAFLYAVTAGALWRMLRSIGDFRWWVAAAFPVPLLFFVAVFARSVWSTWVRRSVTWRGRTIDLRPDPADAGVGAADGT